MISVNLTFVWTCHGRFASLHSGSLTGIGFAVLWVEGSFSSPRDFGTGGLGLVSAFMVFLNHLTAAPLLDPSLRQN